VMLLRRPDSCPGSNRDAAGNTSVRALGDSGCTAARILGPGSSATDGHGIGQLAAL